MREPKPFTPCMQDVIEAVSHPGARIHVYNPTPPLRVQRKHPALVDPANHEYLELAICFEGEMTFVGGDAPITLDEGDAVIVKAGAWHYESYRHVRKSYKACWLQPTTQLTTSIFTYYRPPAFLIEEYGVVPELEEISQLQKIAREVSEQPLHWDRNARSMLTSLLIHFDRRKQANGAIPNLSDSNPTRKLFRITQTRFREPLQIQDLAREIGISADHLSRRFRSEAGITFKDYLNTIRVNHAKQLLKLGWSAKKTADECGFSDVYYFGKVFKEKCQMTPGQFQRESRDGKTS